MQKNSKFLRLPLSSLIMAGLFWLAPLSYANEAAITAVDIKSLGDNEYRISVTIKHADTGWDHYANGWEVFDEAGNSLGVRVLAHPHVNEQPFTRSLQLQIPKGVKKITIVASDSVHAENEETFEVQVPE